MPARSPSSVYDPPPSRTFQSTPPDRAGSTPFRDASVAIPPTQELPANSCFIRSTLYQPPGSVLRVDLFPAASLTTASSSSVAAPRTPRENPAFVCPVILAAPRIVVARGFSSNLFPGG